MSAILAEPVDEADSAANTETQAHVVSEPAAKSQAPVSPTPGRAHTVAMQVATALTVLLVLLAGFAVYLFALSGLSEKRAQAALHETFAYQLSQALAPIGPVSEGKPVAVLDIPQIGLHQAVVVQGTSSRDLTHGPGHRADSPLPGQYGVSIVYGRRTAFGAPFADLMKLQVGDRFTATTGQGAATYRVSSFGTSKHPAPANSDNRLVLVTSEDSVTPGSTVTVSADLVSAPQPMSGSLPAVPDDQKGLTSGGGSNLMLTVLWSQALLVLVLITTFAAHRWSRSATYLAAAPAVLAVLWNLYENLACALPNLY